MADPRIALLRELKGEGATRVAFHPDGSLASVEYGDTATALPRSHEDQHDDSSVEVTPPRRPTGMLVPRGDRARD